MNGLDRLSSMVLPMAAAAIMALPACTSTQQHVRRDVAATMAPESRDVLKFRNFTVETVGYRRFDVNQNPNCDPQDAFEVSAHLDSGYVGMSGNEFNIKLLDGEQPDCQPSPGIPVEFGKLVKITLKSHILRSPDERKGEYFTDDIAEADRQWAQLFLAAENQHFPWAHFYNKMSGHGSVFFPTDILEHLESMDDSISMSR